MNQPFFSISSLIAWMTVLTCWPLSSLIFPVDDVLIGFFKRLRAEANQKVLIPLSSPRPEPPVSISLSLPPSVSLYVSLSISLFLHLSLSLSQSPPTLSLALSLSLSISSYFRLSVETPWWCSNPGWSLFITKGEMGFLMRAQTSPQPVYSLSHSQDFKSN